MQTEGTLTVKRKFHKNEMGLEHIITQKIKLKNYSGILETFFAGS
jgi:hypothetical protein